MVILIIFPHIEENQYLDWLKLRSEFEPRFDSKAMNLSCTLFLLTYIYIQALHLIFILKINPLNFWLYIKTKTTLICFKITLYSL